MLKRAYETQVCSIARSLEVVGERWSLLIVRSVMLGRHRFDELLGELGITRSVLTTRLQRLVDESVLKRVPYQERPMRYEYRVTAKGRELFPVVVHLLRWGDAHYPEPSGPPRLDRAQRLRWPARRSPPVRSMRRVADLLQHHGPPRTGTGRDGVMTAEHPQRLTLRGGSAVDVRPT